MHLNIFKRLSLKAKVTVFTVGAFLVGIWSLAFYASRTLQDDMQRLLGEQQLSTAALIAAEVNDELEARLRALEIVAGIVSPAMRGDAADLQSLLAQHTLLLELFNGGVLALDADGTAAADIPRPSVRIGVNYMERDFAIAALKQGKAMFGRPVMGKTRTAPIFAMAVPIRDAGSREIGALVGVTDLGLPNFLDKITQNRYGKTGGHLLIAPQYRLIVTATDKSRVMEVLPPAGKIPVMDRFNDGYEGTDVFVNAMGVELLVSVKRVAASGWNASTVLPTEEAFAPIRVMRRQVLLAAIILTLLAGGLTGWITLRMFRRELSPMLEAAKALARRSDSDALLQPLPVTSQDEIGELIGGFNRLLETLAQREQALLESEARFRSLVEQGPLSMALVRMDGVIEYINQKAIQTFGYTPEDIPDMNRWWVQAYPDAIYRSEVIAQWTRLVEEALAQKREIKQHEYRVTCKNGDVKIVSIFGVWVAQKVLVIFDDITERRQAETERAGLESQLRESQKMQALGTLAGGVAHDFNNMLAMIMGNVELARRDVGPGHAALVSLDEIGKASRRAKDLVQQILAFGRRQNIERKPVALSLVVLESARLLRAGLPARVSLSVDCKADTPEVLADATQVNQILLNLCSNALQAVQDLDRPGVIEISLEARTLDEARGDLRPGRYACLTVSDNGSGMDETTRLRIFEPFFTSKPVGKGTGLGLSVVHGIVKAHEASIEVESAPEKGSTFRIYFPALEAQDLAEIADAPGAAPVQGRGKHILYVDDEEGLVVLMRRLLTRRGFRVSGYTDPREALAAVRAGPELFDLVVTDFNMPHMSGMEVAQALREIRADLPVILASGYITEDLRAQAPAAGICELIYKPNTADELCEAVARCAHANKRSANSS